MLAAPRHLNCRGKTTRKYADRPQKYPPNIKWTLHWLEFCKYQLLDRFLDTSTHQKKNTGLRNRAANSSPQAADKCWLQLCLEVKLFLPNHTSLHTGTVRSTLTLEVKLHQSDMPSSPSTTKTKRDALNISIFQLARDRTLSHRLPRSGLPLNYMSTAHTNETLGAQFLFCYL